MPAIYAHTREGRPEAEWEPLPDHLERVATCAEEFCVGFAPGFGRALGQLHDIGKYQPRFQTYLRACAATDVESSAESQKTQHAIVGATWAWEQQAAGMMLALAIAAHHGAMHKPFDQGGKIARSRPLLADALKGGLKLPSAAGLLPDALPVWAPDPKAMALGIRMLFSALVDADMLESEAWENNRQRPMSYAPLESLLAALEEDTRELEAALERLSQRAAGQVMRDALQAAGNVMLEAVVDHTPERTDEETPEGTSLPPGILKADMHTQVGLSKKTGTGFVKVGPSKDIGGLVAYRQENGWTFTEHGGKVTHGHRKPIRDIPGKHFMAAAFDESAEAAVDAFCEALQDILGYGENARPENNSHDVEFG